MYTQTLLIGCHLETDCAWIYCIYKSVLYNVCNINLHNKNKQTVQTWVCGMVCLSVHLRTWLFAHFSWQIEAKGSLMDLEPQFPINSVPCSIHCILCCHPPPRSSYGSPRKSLSIDGRWVFRARNWTSGKSHSLKLHSVGQRIQTDRARLLTVPMEIT